MLDTEGPLRKGELERVKAWAREIMQVTQPLIYLAFKFTPIICLTRVFSYAILQVEFASISSKVCDGKLHV